jgi:hypothetical protein
MLLWKKPPMATLGKPDSQRREALKLAPATPGVEVEAVIAFAMVGDTAI